MRSLHLLKSRKLSAHIEIHAYIHKYIEVEFVDTISKVSILHFHFHYSCYCCYHCCTTCLPHATTLLTHLNHHRLPLILTQKLYANLSLDER